MRNLSFFARFCVYVLYDEAGLYFNVSRASNTPRQCYFEFKYQKRLTMIFRIYDTCGAYLFNADSHGKFQFFE